MTEFLKRKIKNGRLNVTSANFVGFSLFISLMVPFFLLMKTFFTSDTDIEKTLTTIIVPTIINMLIIPLFKLISFHQEIEDKLINETKGNKEYLKNKQIIYTECFLMFASSMPITMWYVLSGYDYLVKYHNNIALLISVICWILLIIYFITFLCMFINRYISNKVQK